MKELILFRKDRVHHKSAIVLYGLIILLPVVYLGFPIFQNRHILSELIATGLITLVAVYSFIVDRKIMWASWERWLCSFIIFAAANLAFKSKLSYPGIASSLFLVLLYMGFLHSIRSVGVSRSLRIASFLFTGIITILVIAKLVLTLIWQDSVTSYFFPNRSIFAILIACEVCFVFPLLIHRNLYSSAPSTAFRVWVIWAIISGICLIVFLGGRAAMMGSAVSLGVFLLLSSKKQKIRKRLFMCVLLVLPLLLFSLYWNKPGSSAGRLLIYKIASQMPAGNWITGIGMGEFKVQYNQFQSSYFYQHGSRSNEVWLADNTYYCFNDWYQMLIENGCIGFLLVAISFFSFVKVLLRKGKTGALITAPLLLLVCAGVAALFSYPLQFLPIQVICVFSLALISAETKDDFLKVLHFNSWRRFIPMVAIVLTGVYALIGQVQVIRSKIGADLAAEYAQLGMRAKSLEMYRTVYNSGYMDGLMLFSFGRELYYSNQLEESLAVLKQAEKKYSSNLLYVLMAHVMEQTGDKASAEKFYLDAIQMVPNRLMPKWEIAQYFQRTRDTSKALQWIDSVVCMKIKVPGAIDHVKSEALQMKTKLQCKIRLQSNKSN